MQENNSTDMQKNREHFLEKNILEQVKKKGNIRAILKCILKDDAFKDKNNITSDGYKLHIISNKSEDEKLKSSNVLLEAIVLSELFTDNLSNSEWLNENLKDEYKRSEQGSQYFEIFQNAFKYIGLFKRKYSQTAFDNDTKYVFEKVKSMLSETLTFNGIEKENSLSSLDIENSDSSTVSAPTTPEKNGNDVKVEIKVDGVEEQDKNEIEAENLKKEKEGKRQDETVQVEIKVNGSEEQDKNEIEAENLKKEEEGKRQDEEENQVNEEGDKQGEVSPDEPKENTGNEVKSGEPKENNKDDQTEGEGLFWNVFGAIFSGIGLGGSIAAGATIVLGVGALAALPVVGLILAGVAAATVGLISLGGLIYNLHKAYQIKNQRNKITDIIVLPDSYDSQSLQKVRDKTERKQIQNENKDKNSLENNNGNRKSSIFSSIDENRNDANNPIPKQGETETGTVLPQYPSQ